MNYELIKFNSRGTVVAQLQTLLNSKLAIGLLVDGHFGRKTEAAVVVFQSQSGLIADGIVGRMTWTALLSSRAASESLNPQKQLAAIAATYIGTKETGNNRAGEDAKLLEIFKADDLVINGKTDGYPWCASFVSLCVQKLCIHSSYFSSLNAPREPSVWRFLAVWAKNNGCTIFSSSSAILSPKPGDIVVFTFSHIGIVESVSGNKVVTIEGNTNNAGSREGQEVARKVRSLNIIKSFIRLPYSNDGLARAH
jgi:hypothetical protein